MRRRSSKRKTRKRSKGKRNHAYEIAKARVKLSSRPLVGFWQIRGGTVLSLLLLVILGWLTSQFFTTDRFYVYGASIRGNQLADRNEIYAASGLHEISIFWIKPEQVEAAICSLPGVKEVRVTCRLPNRVTIEVVEHQVRIIWQKDGEQYGVDDRGAFLVLEGEFEGIPLIEDLTPGPLEVDDGIDPEIVASALELGQLFPEATAFQYLENKGLSLDQGSCSIHFGVGDIAEKVAILNALLQDLASEGVQPEFVDLRVKESPCYE
jgi:cell division septal protein FtsQ